MVIACFSLSGKWKITKSKQKSKGCYIGQWQRWDHLSSTCAMPIAFISNCWRVWKSRQHWHFRAYAKTHAGVLGNAHITRVNARSPQQASDERLGSERLFVSLDLLCRGSTFLMEWKEGIPNWGPRLIKRPCECTSQADVILPLPAELFAASEFSA